MVVVIIWVCCLAILSAIVFGKVHFEYSDHVVTHAEDTTYIAFFRNAWAVCICWIIIACNYGYGGTYFISEVFNYNNINCLLFSSMINLRISKTTSG